MFGEEKEHELARAQRIITSSRSGARGCAFSHATSESGLLWGGGEGRRAEQEADNQIIEISFCNLAEWDDFSRCLRGKIVAYNGRLDRPLIQPASCSRAMEILCFKFSFIGVSLIARVQF